MLTRWLLSAVVVLGTLTGAARPADDPKKADNPFLAAKKEFERDADALVRKIKAAQTTADQKKYKAQFAELQTRYLGKLVAIAEKRPAEEDTFHLLTELIELGGDYGKKAVELIAAHHVAKAWVKPALPELSKSDDAAALDALAAVAAKNPDRDNRGLAHLFLGLSQKRQAAAAGEKQKAVIDAAAKALTAARDEYADVKLRPGEKIGKAAAAALVGLANLPNLAVGKVAPDIAGEDLDGKPFKLSDYKGKVVLVDFWATWCPPCMRLVPHNRRLVEQHAGRPFALIGVNVDDDPVELAAEVKRHKVNWRSFKNAAGDGPTVTDQWNVQGFPTLYLIDHTGVIRKVWEELPNAELLEKDVAELVAAAEKK